MNWREAGNQFLSFLFQTLAAANVLTKQIEIITIYQCDISLNLESYYIICYL